MTIYACANTLAYGDDGRARVPSAPKKISAPIASEQRSQMRRRNDEINRPFKFVNKLVRQANASLSGIEGSSIPQFCHRSRDNDEFHFSPARTNAIAS